MAAVADDLDPVEEAIFFDRRAWIDRFGALQPAVFLDLNFWIPLATSADEIWRSLRARLESMASAKRVAIPVSVSILQEAWKLVPERRSLVARTMDVLSRGLSLRVPSRTFLLEFDAALRGVPARREFAYSFFLDAFGNARLEWPSTSARSTGATIEEMSRTLFQDIERHYRIQTYFESLERSPDRAVLFERTGSNLEVLCREELAARARERPSPHKVRAAEFAATVRAHRDEISLIIALLARRGATFRPMKPRSVLESCTTFWSGYRLLESIRISGTAVRPNDLWDRAHLNSAIGYVDLICTDRKMTHVCESIGTVARGSRAVAKPAELSSWLDGIK